MRDFLELWADLAEIDFCILLAFVGALCAFTSVLGALAFLGSNYALLYLVPLFLGALLVFLGIYPIVVQVMRLR